MGSGSSDVRNNCGTITPSIPAGSVGDLLVALVVARENSAALTATGWSQYYTDTYPGEEFQVAIYYRTATGSDPNSFSQSGTCDSFAAQIARFSGVDTSDPFDDADGSSSGNALRQDSNHIDTGSVTRTTSTSLPLVASFVMDNRTVTPGSGWSEAFDTALNVRRDLALALSYQASPPAAGSLSVSGWSLSSGGIDPNYGVILALRAQGGSSLTINVPLGTASGDVMIASVAARPDTIGIAPPAGWTLLRQTTQPSVNASVLATYYRVASPSEPASYTWTLSGTHAGAVGGIASFSGADTANPIDAEAGTATASGLVHTAPGVTLSGGGMLVTVHEFTSAATWTSPAGMTEVVDVASLPPDNAAGISMQINYEVRGSGGATGSRAATASAGGDSGAAHSVALKALVLSCFSDDFNRANGSPGSGWIVSNSGGSFGNPVIFNNRLRLTDASNNAATLATLQRLFPGAGNRIEVEFEHFAYGGSGADGIAVVLSDASVSPVPGAYGGSLGYAQRTGIPGFSGGWIGVGIDEYGNFSNPTEGRNGGPGFFPDSITIRGSGSGSGGYRYHRMASSLSPGVDGNGAASPPHRYRVIIDHSNGINAWVSVERDTGSGYTTLVPAYDAKAESGQAAVPVEWLLSYTASTGGSTNVHEIDNLVICATSQYPISQVDHFAINHDGSGLTCEAEPVVISAHDASDNLVAADGTLNISTSTNLGSWSLVSGSAGSFTNLGNGAATYVFNGETSITLALSYRRAETVNIDVNMGGIVEGTGAEDPDLVVTNTGFRVVDSVGSTIIGTQIAGKPSSVAPGAQSLFLEAVRTDLNSFVCVGMFPDGGDVAVELGSTCVSPATCLAGQQLSVTNNGTTTALPNPQNQFGGSDYRPVTLRFGTDSKAALDLSYSDVGRINLRARYNLPDAGGNPTGEYMSGGSNAFVVRPFGFDIDFSGDRAADWADNNVFDGTATSYATSHNGSIFAVAGADFPTTITAVRWASADDADNDGVPDTGANLTDNAATPGFGREGETVNITHTLVAPALGSGGVLSPSATGIGGFSNGAATVNLSWSEVGIIHLSAALSDGDYLGSGVNVTGVAQNVGRFRPDHFIASVADDGELADACAAGAFTYTGQSFGYRAGEQPRLTIVPRTAGNADIQNYVGAWNKLALSGVTISPYDEAPLGSPNDATQLGADGANRVTYTRTAGSGAGLATLTAAAGSLTYTMGEDSFVYTKHPQSLIAPFTTDVRLDVTAIADADGVTGIGLPVTLSPTGVQMRFGRLRLNGAYGSETRDHTMPLLAEYYNGSAWVTNTADGCTSIDRDSQITLRNAATGGGAWQPGNTTMTVGGGTSQASPATVNLAAGAAGLSLSAPGSGNTGYVEAQIDLGALPWLQFDWDNDGAHDDNPPLARVSFGIYKGSGRVIYLRERY